MTWRNSVCQVSSASAIANINAFVSSGPSVTRSAIDGYYAATEGILASLGPSYFTTYPKEICNLLYIGLISATENYFRDVLGFVLSICPIAKDHAAEEKVQLGSYLWGGSNLHGRTAFDFIAFSSPKNVSETMAKFVRHQIKENGVWHRMLPEYGKLCELRHGIVHSGSVISGKNALKLGLAVTPNELTIAPSYAGVQEAGDVCTSLVQGANNELFEAMVSRWALDWRKLPSWNSAESTAMLKRIFEAFLSTKDVRRGSVSGHRSFRSFSAAVKSDFGL